MNLDLWDQRELLRQCKRTWYLLTSLPWSNGNLFSFIFSRHHYFCMDRLYSYGYV